ncbi:MAG TPA: cupin domain-containing protein [Longimicrobium sp.]
MQSYLDGAVTVQVPGGDAGAGLFRAADARGGVAWLARGEPFAYLHVVEFRSPGDRRGFHVHAGHDERFFVFSGTVRLLVSKGGVRTEIVLSAGSLAALAPGVAHGFVAETPAIAVSFGAGTDPIHDTAPAPDLG